MTDGAPTNNLLSEAESRLKDLLRSAGEAPVVQPLTPDASTREYFRISWKGDTRIACVYPEPFGNELPFLDVTALFSEAGLPVADVVETAGDRGIVIQEDLGDITLSKFLQTAEPDVRESMIDRAVSMIAKIQAATPLAYERASIASKLKFDVEKLGWELDFFLEHYFGSLRNRPLPKSLENDVRRELGDLAEELEGYSVTLTHRDFHASNLMVSPDGALRIIDHQDARIGSSAYDLVSLLLDRVTETPDESGLREKRAYLLQARADAGLNEISPEDFSYEFDLAAVQRCLKAIGTFSNQAGNFGKSHYTVYIDPMYGIVSETCRKRGWFPAVREMIALHTGE
jgi:aminoglycoside/choline kinase family phosphotransferase